MDIREVHEPDRERYNASIEVQPYSHIFQSYEWGEVKEISGWRPKRFLVEDGGKPAGGFQILERKFPKINKRIFYCPCGPSIDLTDMHSVQTFMEFSRTLAKTDGGVFLKVDPPVPDDVSAVKDNLKAAGFSRISEGGSFEGIQPRCVMHLDIRGTLDDILGNMDHKWRYNIRLAERKGVKVRVGTREDIRPFYDILAVTGKRDGFLIRQISYFERLYDTLVPKDMARLFMADYEGAPISGTLAMRFGDKCWYVYGASGNEYRSLMPNHALQWAMIQWAKENGCPVYDFRGIPCDLSPDHPLHGLVRFKKGFGAYPVTYVGEHELEFSKMFSLVHRYGMPLYTKARKLISR